MRCNWYLYYITHLFTEPLITARPGASSVTVSEYLQDIAMEIMYVFHSTQFYKFINLPNLMQSHLFCVCCIHTGYCRWLLACPVGAVCHNGCGLTFQSPSFSVSHQCSLWRQLLPLYWAQRGGGHALPHRRLPHLFSVSRQVAKCVCVCVWWLISS